jgi:hypothetical protein
MYEHLVFFKFNDNLTEEKAAQLLAKLQAFKGVIPGIIELSAGMNEEIERGRGYTLGLRVTFDSREALEQYGPHPVHQDFVKELAGVIDHVAVVDYKI